MRTHESSIVLPAPPPLAAWPHAGARPLSYQQEGWRHVERREMVGYRGPSHEYCSNNHLALTIDGHVDVPTLNRALTAIVQRHSTLRSVFDESGGAPFQIVRDTRPIDVEVVDVSREVNPDATARRMAAQVVLRPFRYAHDQLLRAAVFSLSETSHLLVIVMPHLVSDASSLQVMTTELASYYREQTMPADVSRVVDYGDFVMWQRDWLRHRARADVLTYYRQRIAGVPPLAFHNGAALDNIRTWNAASCHFELASRTAAAVRSASWRARVTPFVLLFAAYQAVLWIWTQHDDIIVTAPFSGRRDARTASSIGFFACLALVRVRLSGRLTFHELLARTHAVVKEAYANEGLPYGALKEIAAELGDPEPPMTVCINLAPEERLTSPTAPFAPAHVSIEAAGGHRLTRYDVNLLVRYASDGQIGGQLRYAIDSLDARSAQTFVDHLVSFLDAAVGNPDRPISEIARVMLDQQEVPTAAARAAAARAASLGTAGRR